MILASRWSFRFAVILFALVSFVVNFGPSVLADTYNCGTYGSGAYQNNVCGASTDSGSDSGLVNTGQSIWLVLVAALLILAGVILLYRTRKKMKARVAQQ